MSSAAKRYASAFIATAEAEEALDALGPDLETLTALLEDSEEFSRFVAEPRLSAARRREILAELFEGKLQRLSLRLLDLLVERDRFDLLAEVVAEALRQWKDLRGLLTVAVTSASALTPDQERALTEKLGKRTGREVKVHCEVDPSLIGGFRLKIGDQVEDHSLAAKLETFKRNVINA